MTGLGRSTIYRLQADQQFPQSIKLGIRAVGWLEREVQEWLAERVASSRDKQLYSVNEGRGWSLLWLRQPSSPFHGFPRCALLHWGKQTLVSSDSMKSDRLAADSVDE